MPHSAMRIDDAIEADVPAITAIYNHVLLTSTAIYREDPVEVDERLAFFRGRQQDGYPILVARAEAGEVPGVEAGTVLGFATFGDFRAWPGYRFTVEHSVHVKDGLRGRGIGTALMRELIARGSRLGKHVMIAGVDADNAGSIRMHERLGFVQTGHLKEVGWKFGRWLDLVFLQRHL
jgi:L-amino acid N-acyltransferase YncA